MSDEIILITGGTGFIGIKVLQTALRAGYHVRAAVRSESRALAVLGTSTIRAIDPKERLRFEIVPDILADNAYDKAVQGVKYIVHIASPVIKGSGFTAEQFETHIIHPAIKGTQSILAAAIKTPSVKRIIFTSSVAGIVPFDQFVINEVDTVFDDKSEVVPLLSGPYSSPLEAYAASKAHCLNIIKKFVQQKQPHWDIINIIPGLVIGDNQMIENPKLICDGTVAAALAQILGGDSGWGSVPSTSVHVDDVAWLHIQSLNSNIQGNQSFLAISGGEKGTTWEEAIQIVNRHFPEAVKKGILPNNGTATTKKVKIDSSRTEKVFGFKFKSYEEQVCSVVDKYLQLLGEPTA